MAALIHRHDHHPEYERERPKSTLITAAVLSSIGLVLFLIYGVATIYGILTSG